MGNPITWFEVNGPAPEKAATFYSELFGWSMQPIPDANYIPIDTHAGSGINGCIGMTRDGQPPHAVFYAENPNIQELLGKAESLGGKEVIPFTEVPGMVTFAQFTDPFGNLVGLVQGDGSTAVSGGEHPPVDWFELSCSRPQAAWDFYRQLFGWTIKGDEGEHFVHGQVDTGGGIRGGVGSSPDGTPHVALYASMDDLQKYLERAEALGGKAITEPTRVDEHTSIAMFVDPQGTAFGIYSMQD